MAWISLEAIEPEDVTPQVSSPDTITAVPGTVDEDADKKLTWSEKVASGINVGSQWISWGLLKGAEYTGRLVEKVKMS